MFRRSSIDTTQINRKIIDHKIQVDLMALTERKQAFKRHLLTKKTKKQKRHLIHLGLVASVDAREVKELLRLDPKKSQKAL